MLLSVFKLLIKMPWVLLPERTFPAPGVKPPTRLDCEPALISIFFFKQKTAYEITRCWSSDVCSSDLGFVFPAGLTHDVGNRGGDLFGTVFPGHRESPATRSQNSASRTRLEALGPARFPHCVTLLRGAGLGGADLGLGRIELAMAAAVEEVDYKAEQHPPDTGELRVAIQADDHRGTNQCAQNGH